MAACPDHAARLTEVAVEVAEVLHDEPAHHEIERAVPERETRVKVAAEEADRRGAGLPPGFRDHPCREVHARHRGPRGGQPERVAAGAAAEVEHGEAADLAGRLPDGGVFQGDKGIAVVVVDARPAVVALADVPERVGRRRVGHRRGI